MRGGPALLPAIWTGGWEVAGYGEASRTVLGQLLPDNGAVKPKPMLLTAGPLRPDSDRYAFAVKWDGFRALIEAAPSGVRIWSRNGHDMTSHSSFGHYSNQVASGKALTRSSAR